MFIIRCWSHRKMHLLGVKKCEKHDFFPCDVSTSRPLHRRRCTFLFWFGVFQEATFLGLFQVPRNSPQVVGKSTWESQKGPKKALDCHCIDVALGSFRVGRLFSGVHFFTFFSVSPPKNRVCKRNKRDNDGETKGYCFYNKGYCL